MFFTQHGPTLFPDKGESVTIRLYCNRGDAKWPWFQSEFVGIFVDFDHLWHGFDHRSRLYQAATGTLPGWGRNSQDAPRKTDRNVYALRQWKGEQFKVIISAVFTASNWSRITFGRSAKWSRFRMFCIWCQIKERHLICGKQGGYLVDNCGRVVQGIAWASLPLGFEFSAPFLFVSHFYGIELVRIGVGQVSPPTILSSYRPRLLGTVSDGKLIVLSRPYGDSRTNQAGIASFKLNYRTPYKLCDRYTESRDHPRNQAAVKVLTGTDEIEFDDALSGPSSLASSNGHFAVSVYKPPRQRYEAYRWSKMTAQNIFVLCLRFWYCAFNFVHENSLRVHLGLAV